MLSKHTIELWHRWLILFACSIIIYSIIYTCAFRKQLSNSHLNPNQYESSKQIENNAAKTNQSNNPTQNPVIVKSNVSTIAENGVIDDKAKQIHLTVPDSNQLESTSGKVIKDDNPYSPLKCMLYASCVCSLINALICSLASLSIFHHKYWENPIYGTPGIPFYANCPIQAYFLVDLCADIIIYFMHKLPSFRYDQLIHHSFAFAVIPWMIVPEPTYAWFMITLSYAMEVSTLFLDFSFFSKWYKCKESVTTKFKFGFLLTWFMFRCPACVAMLVWLVLYGERVWNEYPLHKFIGVVFIIGFNTVMQGLWTILIIRKTYRALTAEKPSEKKINLKRRRNSIEISNVTSVPQ